MPLPTDDELRELPQGIYSENDASDVIVFGRDAENNLFGLRLTPEEAEKYAHDLIVKAFLVRSGA